MKLAIITAVWQRPEVFELYARGIKELKPNVELQVFIVGSEGHKSKQMVGGHGFRYFEYSNTNLSHKHNYACKQARGWKADYCLFLGSDDVISQSTYDFLESEMKKGTDFIGFTDFYFYDLQSQKTAYWGGYRDARRGHTVGAGRLVSRRLMDKWRWEPFESKHKNVLDDSMQQKLRSEKYSKTITSLKSNNLHAIDIKSPVNMTPFQLWDNTDYIDKSELKEVFPWMIK